MHRILYGASYPDRNKCFDKPPELALTGYPIEHAYIRPSYLTGSLQLYCQGYLIAMHQLDDTLYVYPAYQPQHENILNTFLQLALPSTPLTSKDFTPKCGKVYLRASSEPKEVKIL